MVLDMPDIKEVAMTTQPKSYLMTIISALGVVAFVAALIIAWPALTYIISKLFS